MPKPQESHRKDPAPASVPALKASISFLSSGGGGNGWYRRIRTNPVKNPLIAGFFRYWSNWSTHFWALSLIRVEGVFGRPAKGVSMPDLAAMLVRSSIGTLAHADASCGDCRRTPLAGERMHE